MHPSQFFKIRVKTINSGKVCYWQLFLGKKVVRTFSWEHVEKSNDGGEEASDDTHEDSTSTNIRDFCRCLGLSRVKLSLCSA